jgi:DNA-binding NarL/FixJ family response regulator
MRGEQALSWWSRTSRARVLIADDQISFVGVLRDVVRRTERLEVVGEADSGETAVELTRRLEPDIVILDVRMPGLGGIGAAKRIKTRYPSTLVILISTVHPDELPFQPRDSGADAVIWKSELEPKLLDEIWLRQRPLGPSF